MYIHIEYGGYIGIMEKEMETTAKYIKVCKDYTVATFPSSLLATSKLRAADWMVQSLDVSLVLKEGMGEWILGIIIRDYRDYS